MTRTEEDLDKEIASAAAKILEVVSEIKAKEYELREVQQQYSSSPTSDLSSHLDFLWKEISRLGEREEDLRQKEEDLRNEKADLRKAKQDLIELDLIRAKLLLADDGASDIGKAEDRWIAGSPSSNQTMTTQEIAIVEEDSPIFWDLPGADRGAAEAFSNFCKAIPRAEGPKAARTRSLFSDSNSYSLKTPETMVQQLHSKYLECLSP